MHSDIFTNSGMALEFPQSRVELPESFAVQILGDQRRTVDAKGLKLIGRRLIAQVSECVNPEDCIRIDCPDSFLLGEVLGSWREGNVIFAAMELQQALTSVSELSKWNGDRSETRRLVEMRQSA